MNQNEISHPTDISIFDPEYLNQMLAIEMQLQKKLIPVLIQSFEELSEQFLSKCFQLAESKDFEQLKKDAHCLKSSCGQLGATKLAIICQKIETHSSSKLDDYLIFLFEFKSLYPLTKTALKDYQRRIYDGPNSGSG